MTRFSLYQLHLKLQILYNQFIQKTKTKTKTNPIPWINLEIVKHMNKSFDSLSSHMLIDKASFAKLKVEYYKRTKKEFRDTDFLCLLTVYLWLT